MSLPVYLAPFLRGRSTQSLVSCDFAPQFSQAPFRKTVAAGPAFCLWVSKCEHATLLAGQSGIAGPSCGGTQSARAVLLTAQVRPEPPGMVGSGAVSSSRFHAICNQLAGDGVVGAVVRVVVVLQRSGVFVQ